MNSANLSSGPDAAHESQTQGSSAEAGHEASAVATAALISAASGATLLVFALLSVALAINPGLGVLALAASTLLGGLGVVLGLVARRGGRNEHATGGIVLGGLVALANIMIVLYITPVGVITSGG